MKVQAEIMRRLRGGDTDLLSYTPTHLLPLGGP